MTGTPILTAAEMRAAERAVFAGGVPEYALMERAGAAAAEIIWRAGARRETLVLCGPGNNGGDGFVVARLLRERGVPVRVAATGESRTPSSLTARAAWAGPVEALADARPAAQIVDALFGTGLTRGLDAPLADRLGELVRAAGHRHAIDLPSGVDTDTGEILSAVPRFGICIGLGALKPAHVLHPSAATFDRLVCADIGIAVDGARAHRLAPPFLSPPAADAHKYSRGLVAVVAGAMAGAGALAASAAGRAGAGYIRFLALMPPGRLPDATVVVPAADTAALGEALADRRIACVLVGPGLGRDGGASKRLKAALESSRPLVIDADGIMLLEHPDQVPPASILTPHEGEFAHLFGTLGGSKIDRARAAARLSASIIIHKGPDTVVAAPDGRVAVAPPASSWLSTAGTGDVLAGITAARLAVVGDPFRAACEAVWLHGEIARRAGPAFIADDLVVQLSSAMAGRLHRAGA